METSIELFLRHWMTLKPSVSQTRSSKWRLETAIELFLRHWMAPNPSASHNKSCRDLGCWKGKMLREFSSDFGSRVVGQNNSPRAEWAPRERLQGYCRRFPDWRCRYCSKRCCCCRNSSYRPDRRSRLIRNRARWLATNEPSVSKVL